MSNSQEQYNQYKTIMQKAADINYAAAVLGWDQETYMPPKGAEYRGRQLGTLNSMAHALVSNEAFGLLLHSLSLAEDLDDDAKDNVRLSLEDYERDKKLSPQFVDELAQLTSECFTAWMAARNANDYKLFAPSLAKMIAMKRKEAELVGYKDHPYDALVDEYEKGATVAMLDPLFDGIKEQLPLVLNKIKAAQQVSDECLTRHYPTQAQWDFSVTVLKSMGFDFEAGRQDYSEHPFTTSFSPLDVRLTTRVSEDNFASMLWSCIHEGGHGLYEQGLPVEQYGLPLGSPTSLGIHESQSRIWENCIGRSMSFWKYFYPKLQQCFPSQLGDVTIEQFFKAANQVEPSLVRTEADELTYHFHVMIRYEIEKALIEGSLDPKDLPAEWNRLYQQYLGIQPADDKNGILQDVHWSNGGFGYFPTYTLGSFYAAQFYTQAQKDIPDFEAKIENGDFPVMLQWLREKIQKHGRKYDSETLCALVTGNKLQPEQFFAYAKNKFATVYDIKF